MMRRNVSVNRYVRSEPRRGGACCARLVRSRSFASLAAPPLLGSTLAPYRPSRCSTLHAGFVIFPHSDR